MTYRDEINRRTFFKLTTAAVAVASVPGPVQAVLSAVEDPLGGWIPCDGRLLYRASFPDLFLVIGDTYGGDVDKFCLPNFTGQVNTMNDRGDADVKGLVSLIKARRDSNEIIPVGCIQMAYVA